MRREIRLKGKYEEPHEQETQKGTGQSLGETPKLSDDSEGEPRKYYVNGGSVEIVADVVYELDPDGKRLSANKIY